jgi:hypothetical protein
VKVLYFVGFKEADSLGLEETGYPLFLRIHKKVNSLKTLTLELHALHRYSLFPVSVFVLQGQGSK